MVPGRDKARVKRAAIQANATLGLNLTVSKILKRGGKKQKTREIARFEAAPPRPPAVTTSQPSAFYVLHILVQKACQVNQRFQ